MSSAVILSENTLSTRKSDISDLVNPNGLGALEKLPREVICKIFEELLAFQEKAHFLRTSSSCQAVLQKSWENIRKKYLLPTEAFGNMRLSEEILPMPKELLEVLNGPDGHLYFPVLKTSYFINRLPDSKKEIFPATYKGIEKASNLRDGLGYQLISKQVVLQQGSCNLEEIHWILMTKDVFLESRSRTYPNQVTFVKNWIHASSFLREGFEIPKDPRDAVYAIFYQFCQDQIRLYSDSPYTYMRSQKSVNGWQIVIGAFRPSGLQVTESFDINDETFGVALLRKFLKGP